MHLRAHPVTVMLLAVLWTMCITGCQEIPNAAALDPMDPADAPPPMFGIEVSPVGYIIAEAGDMVKATVNVSNTGSEIDRIDIYLNLSDLDIPDLPYLHLSPRVKAGATQAIDFLWSVPEDATPGRYDLPVNATSRYAGDMGLNVSDDTILVLNVLPATAGGAGGDGEGVEERDVHPILRTCIFLVLMMFIVIILYVLFRRRKDLEDEEDAEEMMQELDRMLQWSPDEVGTADAPASKDTPTPPKAPVAPAIPSPGAPRAHSAGGPVPPMAATPPEKPPLATHVTHLTGEDSPPLAARLVGNGPPAARAMGDIPAAAPVAKYGTPAPPHPGGPTTDK